MSGRDGAPASCKTCSVLLSARGVACDSRCLPWCLRSYFVLSGGELKYYKTEKAAHLSNADSLKAIRLEHVLAASANPRHADMFIIDLGLERKVRDWPGSPVPLSRVAFSQAPFPVLAR